MKKTFLTLIATTFVFFCNAQWEPNELDALRGSINLIDMTPDGQINEINFVKKIEQNINQMNYPKRGCKWTQTGPGNVSLCCCTKSESVFFEIPATGFTYGMYSHQSTVGPWFDPTNNIGATLTDYRNSTFDIVKHIVDKIFERDLTLVEIEKIEIEPCLHPQAPDILLTICKIKVWYKKCVEYNNCQFMSY